MLMVCVECINRVYIQSELFASVVDWIEKDRRLDMERNKIKRKRLWFFE